MPVQPQRWRKQAIARMMLVLLNCQGIFDMSQHTQHVCFMYVSFLLAGKMQSVQNQQKKTNFVNQMMCRLLKVAPLLLYQQSCQSMSILDFMNIHKLYGICVCLVSSTNAKCISYVYVFFLAGKSPKKKWERQCHTKQCWWSFENSQKITQVCCSYINIHKLYVIHQLLLFCWLAGKTPKKVMTQTI